MKTWQEFSLLDWRFLGWGMAGRGNVGCAHIQDKHTTGRQVCMVSLSAFEKTVLAAEALWLLEHGNWRCAVSFLSDIGRYSAWPCWPLCLLAVQFCFIGTMSYFSTGGFAASCFLILTAFVTFSAMCCNATMSLLCLTPWYFLGGTLMEYLNRYYGRPRPRFLEWLQKSAEPPILLQSMKLN